MSFIRRGAGHTFREQIGIHTVRRQQQIFEDFKTQQELTQTACKWLDKLRLIGRWDVETSDDPDLGKN